MINLKITALKAEFDFRLYRDKFENAKGVSERLKDEKDRMTEMLEEIRLQGRSGTDLANMPSGSSVDSIELLPPVIRQKLTRLEVRIPNY